MRHGGNDGAGLDREEGNVSLAIDVDKVFQVLLVDGWYRVANASFILDSYEYIWWPLPKEERVGKYANSELVHGGGASGICSTGFQFKTDTENIISGPLTSILAVKHYHDPE